MKELQITWHRLLIVLAMMTAIGWAWAIAEHNIPPLVFFIFGMAAPFAFFVVFVSRGVGEADTGKSAANQEQVASGESLSSDASPSD